MAYTDRLKEVCLGPKRAPRNTPNGQERIARGRTQTYNRRRPLNSHKPPSAFGRGFSAMLPMPKPFAGLLTKNPSLSYILMRQ